MKDIRREYASRSLDDGSTDPDPMAQFQAWFSEALISQVVDANAMSLATATSAGEPSVRTVLLKGVDEHGFVFFTHYTSPKGNDLAANPRACVLFYWAELERQVRITGSVVKLPRQASEVYFASRPLASQWAACAAAQSSELPDRETLELRFEAIKRAYPSPPVPCPPNWGGYQITPERMEFWQGRPSRLHDRILYTKQADNTWTRARLAP